MPVAWTQDLATGIRAIDEQHRDLFANVAALRDSMRLGNSSGAVTTMRFLERYVQDHFRSEERWMEAAEYPGLAEHRTQHQLFTAEFRRRMAGFRAKGPTASLVIELSDWLGEWLREHVSKVDVKMGQFLRASQTRPAGTRGPA
jgi:hemerythrin